MQKILSKAERLTNSVSLFSANIAAIVLLVLVALTCIDVIGRYFFNSPLNGAVELVEICMGAITFFSFPLMFLRNDHIIVDLIPQFRRGHLGWITSIIFLAVILFISIKLGLRVFDYAARAFEDGDVTEYLLIPRYPIVGFITAAIFSVAAITLLRLALLITQPGLNAESQGEENPGEKKHDTESQSSDNNSSKIDGAENP